MDLKTAHTLTWQMLLKIEGRHTVHELVDGMGARWGWLVDTGDRWTAHVGDFGQAASMRLPIPPLSPRVKEFQRLCDAKEWVEESVSEQWSSVGYTPSSGDNEVILKIPVSRSIAQALSSSTGATVFCYQEKEGVVAPQVLDNALAQSLIKAAKEAL